MATATLVGNDRDLPSSSSSSSVVSRLTPDKEEEEQEKADEDEVFRKLQTDYERSREERRREQDLAEAERRRLDEILRLCCERDLRNLRLEPRGQPPPLPVQRPAVDERRDSRSSWGSGTKIKTNGSLTSLVTHNRRSDDVGTSVFADGCVITETTESNALARSQKKSETESNALARSQKKSETESNALARSQKIESNRDGIEIAAKSSSSSSFALFGGENSDGYSVNPSSNRFDRSNRYLPSTAVDRDCTGNGFMPAAWRSQAAEEACSRTDSAVDRDCLDQRNGRPGGEMVMECNAVSYPHPLSNGNNRIDNNLPRNFNGHIGFDQNLKESRRKRSAEDVKERIRVLQLRILDVKNLEEKTINETQSELELLQWEYSGLIEQLRREKDRIAAINHQQMELLLEAAKERAEAEKQIESERIRLEELEKHLEETRRKRLATPGTGPVDDVTLPGSGAPGDLVVKETEELELRRRQFDDLEFHLLEVETRREEEREPQQRKLAAELDQLKHSCTLVEETLRQLLDQKSSLIRQLKSDVIDLERERILLIEDFRKEKERLYYLLRERSSLRLNTHPSQPTNAVNTREDAGTCRTALEQQLLTPDEETFPATPSSTTSVIQRLQDLQRQTAPDVPGVSGSQRHRSLNEEEEDERTDEDSLRSPDSAVSYDHLRCWFSAGVALRQDNNNTSNDDNNDNGGSRFLSASDEDGSILSSDERFDERSYGTSGSQVFFPSYQQNDVSSSSVNRYSIRGTQSASEVSAISLTAVGDWTNDDSVSHVNESQETPEVVMRQSQRRQARPMTRYLPVRGPRDLDLRQFIESAGHRLDDDCGGAGASQVQVTSSTCRGFLVKLGRRFRLWHRRWFVFDRRRRSVSYYSDETERRARGCILFGAIENVFVDHLMRKTRGGSSSSSSQSHPRLTFCLKTTARTLVLMAPSAEAMRIWIDVLVTGAEGYQEFI